MAEKTTVSDSGEPIVSDEGGSKGDTVTREAYDRAIAQRKADQKRAKDLEDERNKLLQEKEEREATALADQKKYQELYEKEKKKREESDSRLSDMTKAQVTKEKQQALSTALGGLKKNEFLKFANLDGIAMNEDGTVDAASVTEVANKFRADYPELVPSKPANGHLPNDAARGGSNGKTDRKLTDLTHNELVALRKQTAAREAANKK